MMEVAGFSKRLADFYHNIRCHIQEDGNRLIISFLFVQYLGSVTDEFTGGHTESNICL